MTIQVQLVLTALDGRGSTHQIHIPSLHPISPPSSPNSPPFRAFNHYSCYVARKTHSAEADTQTLDAVNYQAGSHGRIYRTK
jgi:hypothetical protein